MSAPLIVLGVKRALDQKIPEASKDRYSTFYSSSTVDETVFPLESADDFLNYVIDDIMGTLSPSLRAEKDKIVANLEIMRDIGALEDGAQSACAVNQLYDKGKGKFFQYMYSFVPQNQDIVAEQLTVSFNCNLADSVIVLYKTKKTWFGQRKTQEETKIPPLVSKDTVVTNLAIALAPLVYKRIPGPSMIIDDLIAQAQNVKSTKVSDTHRMYYDPITKMTKIATDPEILKLIPTVWEKAIFETPLSNEKVARINYDFDF